MLGSKVISSLKDLSDVSLPRVLVQHDWLCIDSLCLGVSQNIHDPVEYLKLFDDMSVCYLRSHHRAGSGLEVRGVKQKPQNDV